MKLSIYFFRRNSVGAAQNQIRIVNLLGVKESLTYENKSGRFLAYKVK